MSNFGYEQALFVLLGNVVLGFSAFLGVIVTANNLRRLEQEKRNHEDAGVRRQVRALLKQMSGVIRAGFERGDLSPEKWKATYYTFRDRLMASDVPRALSDERAEAIYEALESIRVARWAAKDLEATWTSDRNDEFDRDRNPQNPELWRSEQHKMEMRDVYAKPNYELNKVLVLFEKLHD